jgi:hypothetical protein
MFSNVRRARAAQGEERGQIIGGVRLDDNSYANLAIKRALGLDRGGAEGFEACHIWPRTCYDHRFHTALANLVLLPRALAGLSDHDPEIQAALQFRSYELYDWRPDGATAPQRPQFYPRNWRDPEPDHGAASRPRIAPRSMGPVVKNVEMSGEERLLVVERVQRWAAKPKLNVHKIIALVAKSHDGVARAELVNQVTKATATTSQKAYGAIASLLTSKGRAYGRVFEDVAGVVRLHPDISDAVLSFRWNAD